MDLAFTTEEEAFRAEVRDWVGSNLPPEIQQGAQRATPNPR